MNTTLTRRPIAAPVRPQVQSKEDVMSRLARAQAIVVSARALLDGTENYDNLEYLSAATCAMLATEKTLMSTIRRAEVKDFDIELDVYGVASIIKLTSKAIWDEYAMDSDQIVHASTALDEAEEILTELAGTVGSLSKAH